MPWNIYRLCRLFGSLPLDLKSHDAINDIGAGPLTLVSSLWISRPDLRKVPLEIRCLDRTAAVLEAGKKFFSALVAETNRNAPDDERAPCPWVIRIIRGELKQNGRLSEEIRGKPAALSAAVNVYNELFWAFSPFDREGISNLAERQVRLLSSLTESSGSVLVVEPGIPRSGEFISLLRSGLIREGRLPLSPCVHSEQCPLPGSRTGTSRRAGNTQKTKTGWCHFAFDTEDAPEELHTLSAAAGIPKERAVLSFILAGPASDRAGKKPGSTKAPEQSEKIRVISDSFPVGNRSSRGRYGCCESGLVLVTGSRESLERSPSGTLEELPIAPGLTDAKSGALMAIKN